MLYFVFLWICFEICKLQSFWEVFFETFFEIFETLNLVFFGSFPIYFSKVLQFFLNFPNPFFQFLDEGFEYWLRSVWLRQTKPFFEWYLAHFWRSKIAGSLALKLVQIANEHLIRLSLHQRDTNWYAESPLPCNVFRQKKSQIIMRISH